MALFLSPINKTVKEELNRRIQKQKLFTTAGGVLKTTTLGEEGTFGKPVDAQPQSHISAEASQENRGIYGRSTWMRLTPTTIVRGQDGDASLVPILGGGLLTTQNGLEYMKEGVPRTLGGGTFTDFIASKSSYRGRPSVQGRGGSDNRPGPGINEIAVKHTGEIGAITEVTIKFTAFDFETIEYLTPYYLRVGSNLTVEFGWAEKEAELEALPDVGEGVSIAGWNKGKYVHPQREFYYTTITNFEWSVRADGAIECTVHAVSGGSLIMDKIIGSNGGGVDAILNLEFQDQMAYMTNPDTYARGIGFPTWKDVRKAMNGNNGVGKYGLGIDELTNHAVVGLSEWDGTNEVLKEPYVDGDWSDSGHVVGASRAEKIPEGSGAKEGVNDLPGIVFNNYSWDHELPYYFTWGWFEDNVLTKVMGRINANANDGEGVGLTYRSVEWNEKLNGGNGGYQSTKLTGHKWMLSFNGWFSFLPCESISNPFQMGKLHIREGGTNMHGQGSLLNGVARENLVKEGGKEYTYLYDENGEARKGVVANYHIDDKGQLLINNEVQKSVVDAEGRRPGRFNWRDHFEPALVEETDGAGGTKWQVITRNIVISKRMVDECFSNRGENEHNPTAPRWQKWDTKCTSIFNPEDMDNSLYGRVFYCWKHLYGCEDVWDLKLIPDDHNPQNCKIVDGNNTANSVSTLLSIAKQDVENAPFFFPAHGINSIVKSQDLTCEMPSEMALEIMYGSMAGGYLGSAPHTAADGDDKMMQMQAYIELNTNQQGQQVEDRVWQGMQSPKGDENFGNATPYKMSDAAHDNYNRMPINNSKMGNLNQSNSTSGDNDENGVGQSPKKDIQQNLQSNEDAMLKKKMTQVALFNEAAAGDLRENYDGFRETYERMYNDMPAQMDIRSYFEEVFDDPDAFPPTPPEFKGGQTFNPNSPDAAEAEAATKKIEEIIEWMKLFVGWIQWLQWTKHGGGLDMNQHNFDGETGPEQAEDDTSKIKLKAWTHGDFMRKKYWWCIRYLTGSSNLEDSKGIFETQDFQIPLKIKLTVDGIGGLQYGNAFQSDYIPEQYKDNTIFQMGMIEHRVAGDGWDTTFEGMMRMLPMAEYKTKIQDTTKMNIGPGGINADLLGKYDVDRDPKRKKEQDWIAEHEKYIGERKVGEKRNTDSGKVTSGEKVITVPAGTSGKSRKVTVKGPHRDWWVWEEWNGTEWVGKYDTDYNPPPTEDDDDSAGDWCFLPNQLISMADGTSKEIKDIVVGDLVKAWDKQNNLVKDTSVTDVMTKLHNNVYELHLENNKVLNPTGNHPFLVKDKEWSTIDKHNFNRLEIGDCVKDINGEWVRVKDIVSVEGEYLTYDFENEYETIIADGIVTHQA